MKLKCINSGSQRGNAYILEDSEGNQLLLDAGTKMKEIEKAFKFDFTKIIGACITHHHKDHSACADELSKYGIPIYAPYINTKPIKFKGGSNWRIQSFELTDIDGKFTHTDADGTECKCYGFYIYHPEMGTMLYITDTELVKYRFKNINHILIGCNYQKKYIERNTAKRKHVVTGHMELETVKEFIKCNYTDDLKNVILCHLSDEGANPSEMISEIINVAQTSNVDVASKNKEWNMNLLPF